MSPGSFPNQLNLSEKFSKIPIIINVIPEKINNLLKFLVKIHIFYSNNESW